MSVPVALIAAVARNNVIGANGDMPWSIPSDLAFFKQKTLNKPIIMGRKQFEVSGKPLANRVNIVVTRKKGYKPDGVIVVDSLDAALQQARGIAEVTQASEVMVIGGGDIYRQAMPFADRLYITEVDLAPEGDVVFPEIDHERWVVVDEPEVPLTGRDEASFRVKVYERRKGPQR